MNQSESLKNQSDKAARQKPLISLPLRIILALVYSAAVIIAAENLLTRFLTTSANENPFASQETALIFLRFTAGAGAVALAFLQGVVLALLFSLITRLKRPRFVESWGYVLAGQMPFALAVFIFFLQGGSDAAETLQQQWVRHLSSAISLSIYALLVAAGKNIEPKRLLAFVVLTIASNSALLLLFGQVLP